MCEHTIELKLKIAEMVSLVITCINLYAQMSSVIHFIFKFCFFLKSKVCCILQFKMKLTLFACFEFSLRGGREEEPSGRAPGDNYVIKASREENKLRNSSCVS